MRAILRILYILQHLLIAVEDRMPLFAVGCSFFVAPMRGDAVLGNLVHLVTADLDFHRLSVIHNRGMEGLVAILLRLSDPVSEPVWEIGPSVVQRAEGEVAVFVGFDEDAEPHQIADVLEGCPFLLHFLVDAIDMLCSAVDIGEDVLIFQLFANALYHFLAISLAFHEFFV